MPFTSKTAKIYGFQKGNKARLGMKNSDKQKEAVRNYMKNRKDGELSWRH